MTWMSCCAQFTNLKKTLIITEVLHAFLKRPDNLIMVKGEDKD